MRKRHRFLREKTANRRLPFFSPYLRLRKHFTVYKYTQFPKNSRPNSFLLLRSLPTTPFLRDSPEFISSSSSRFNRRSFSSVLRRADSMALEQSFGEPTIGFGSDEGISLKKRNSVADPTANSGNMMGCFDCNICLDSAHDPVVTLCGHLYCWPCIYKWLQVENSEPGSEETPKCPVCKSHISNSSLVPLYGHGTSSEECRSNESQVDLVVPRRPQAIWTTTTQVNTSSPPTSHIDQQLHHTSLYYPPPSIHHQQFFPHAFGGYAAIAPSTLGGTGMTRLFSPMVVMFSEMLLARMLGGSDASSFSYPYLSSYPMPGGRSSRMRRQEMQMDKSLNRLSIFLFCAFILCLLLF